MATNKPRKGKKLFYSLITSGYLACAAMLTGCAGQATNALPASPQVDTASAAQRANEPVTLFGLKGVANVSDAVIAKSSQYHQLNIPHLRSALGRSKDFRRDLEQSKVKPEQYPASFVALAHLHEKLASEKDPQKIAAAINAMYNMAAYYDQEKVRLSDKAVEEGRSSGQNFIDDPLTLMKNRRGICGEMAVAKAKSLSELLGPDKVWLTSIVAHDYKREKTEGHLVCIVQLEKDGKSDYYVLDDLQPRMQDGPDLGADGGDARDVMIKSLKGVSMTSTLIRAESYFGSEMGDKGIAYPYMAQNMQTSRVIKLDNPITEKLDPVSYWRMMLKPPTPKQIMPEDVLHPDLSDYRKLLSMNTVFAHTFVDANSKEKGSAWAEKRLSEAYMALIKPTSLPRRNGIPVYRSPAFW